MPGDQNAMRKSKIADVNISKMDIHLHLSRESYTFDEIRYTNANFDAAEET